MVTSFPLFCCQSTVKLTQKGPFVANYWSKKNWGLKNIGVVRLNSALAASLAAAHSQILQHPYALTLTQLWRAGGGGLQIIVKVQKEGPL